MSEIITLCRDALVLNTSAFERLRDMRDGFRQGLFIVLAVGLIVGLIASAVSFLGEVTSPSVEQQMEEARQGFDQFFTTMQQFGGEPMDPALRAFILDNVDAGFGMAARIGRVVEETTPLPTAIGSLFEAVGAFVSFPFGWIYWWMLYGIIVLVFARLLGGGATVQQMLATTSLVVVPHLLTVLRFIPCLGFLIGLVAFFWGLAIYVKGTAVANSLTIGRAAVAVFLPVILVALFALIAAILIIVAIAGAQQG